MADNLAVTAGSGTVVATDQVGTAHYQRVKITDGTADSENHLVVDASGNAMVKLAAGTAVIGKLAANTGVDIGDVDVTSCALPTGASTSAKQDTGNTSLASIDGKVPALGQALAAASVPVVLPAAQITTLTPPSTVTIQDGGNVITVDGTVTANATLAAETTKVIGTVNVAAGQTIAVTNAGTFATQATLQAGTAAIGKLAANDGVDIGNVDVASIAAGDNNIGNVDIASALPAGTNTIGKVAPNEYELAGNTTHVKKYYTSAGAATDGIVWSPASGKRWYVTDLIINVSAAATVTLEDDLTAGDSAVFKAELAANSGISHSFNTPLYSGEDAADLLITTSAGNVYVTVTGYEI